MYNRYIPDDTSYDWVGEAQTKGAESGPAAGSIPPGGSAQGKEPLSGLLGSAGSLFSGRGGLSGLLKALHLEDVDTGDILLLLIVLFLLVEGDELELVIALGLVLIMGLGDGKPEEDQ